MKHRIASLALATVSVLLMVTQALAVEPAEQTVGRLDPDPSTEISSKLEGTGTSQLCPFYLNGEPLYGVEAHSFNNTYYVSLRSILPLLEPSAVVEQAHGVATATARITAVTEPPAEDGDPSEPREAVVEVLDTLEITAIAGKNYVIANGRYLYVKDNVKTVGTAIAIPLRTLATILCMAVSYDTETGRTLIVRQGAPRYLEDGDDFYDAESLFWLSRIICCESGNQPMDGKIAVGNVILNRVKHASFPDTIYDVIFQKNQFAPAANGNIQNEPNEESVIAAKLALDGAEALPGVLFFNRAGVACYASKNRPYIATIGGHAFYG